MSTRGLKINKLASIFEDKSVISITPGYFLKIRTHLSFVISTIHIFVFNYELGFFVDHFLLFVFCVCLSYCIVCALQPFGHLLGKG